MVPSVTSEYTPQAVSLVGKLSKVSFNPFYSNIPTSEENENYEFADYKVSPFFP